METYKIPLVPGPVSVPEAYRRAYLTDYGSADLESDFFALLADNERLLQKILHTEQSVAIQSGEAMLILWGALKSTLGPGDRVLCLSNGLFGSGFKEMAEATGAEARLLEAPDGAFFSAHDVAAAIEEYRPHLVTAVHCETPCGLLNPIAEIGPLVRASGALFVVDFVASAIGADVRVDEWCIDLGLLGSQKCLSLLPDLSMLTIGERAWEAAERANYAGYDAILPWRNVQRNCATPYTHNWHANAALQLALRSTLDEGPETIFRRHEEAAVHCRRRAQELGIERYAQDERLASPTVTALWVPAGWSWQGLDGALRKRGVAMGGNYGKLAGRVFRIGHMGSQAQVALVESGMRALADVLHTERPC